MVAAESRALALVGQREQSLTEQYTEEEWQAFKATLGGNISDAQFRVFRAACRRYGLDPIQRQIQCWKGEGGGLVIYAGIDGLRVVSGRSKNVAAEYGPQWCGKDGIWRDEWIADDPPAGARFGIKLRDQEEVIWGFARFKSYNKGGGTWGKYPEVMLAKVAETLCRRRATPNETSGLYVDAELHAVRDQDAEEYNTARVTVVEAEPAALPAPQTVEERDHIAAAAQQSVDKTLREAAQDAPPPPDWLAIHQRMRAVGIEPSKPNKERATFARWAAQKTWEALTDADAPKLIEALARIEAKHAAAEAKVKPAAVAAPSEPEPDVTFEPDTLDLADVDTGHVVP